MHCSSFGVIPKKKGKAGRWRLIVDLSSPAGSSVNDGISSELSSSSYTSVDEVMSRVLELGRGAQMEKAYIKQVYRNVLVSTHYLPQLCHSSTQTRVAHTRLHLHLSQPGMFLCCSAAAPPLPEMQRIDTNPSQPLGGLDGHTSYVSSVSR